MKNRLFKKIIPYIVLLGVILYSYLNEANNDNKIDVYKKMGFVTQGTIIKYNTTGSGTSISYYVKYLYYVNGKEYIKNKKISLFNANIYDASKFIGKKYKVYYNKVNPNEAFIDLKKECLVLK